jgi:hypothetical protein
MSLSSQMQSIKKPQTNHLIQDHHRHHLFLSYYKVDPRTHLIKNHELTTTRRNSTMMF